MDRRSVESLPNTIRRFREGTATPTLRSYAPDTPRDRRVDACAKRDTITAVRRTMAPHRLLL